MLSRANAALAQIHMQIMWSRLIAVVEEQAQTLVRTAFSTTVREAGRSVGRRLRPRRQHAGAGGDRHARPRQFDGGGGQAFPRRLSAEDDARGRPLHHQRPVADLRPSARSDRGQPDLPRRRAGRPLRQHRPCRRYRRARHGAGRPPGVRGGAVDPIDGLGPRRTDERGFVARDPRQCARAAAGRGRCLCARRVQRRRQPAARRDDGGVRHRQSRPAGRAHHRNFARGDDRGDRQAEAGQIPQQPDDGRL